MIGAEPGPAGGGRRDGRGRFVDAHGGTRHAPGGSRAGVRGPTHLAGKPKLELARMLARRMLALRRLQVELDGGSWEGSIGGTRPNMRGIERVRKEATEATLAALDDVMRDLAEERVEPRPTDIARRMTIRLGRPFGVASLYRPPLGTAWREPKDHLGAVADVDGTAEMRACMRLTKRLIVYRLGRIGTSLAQAGEARRRQLVEADASGGDWSAIGPAGRT